MVEPVNGWPGIGHLPGRRCGGSISPIIIGITLVAAVAIGTGNLLADPAALLIDPRIKLW
jgi:ABC-type dipeptide/oligopeptide/nickel transport system permease component